VSSPKNQGVNFAELEKNMRMFGANILRPIRELYDGVKSGTLPWHWCFCIGIALQIGISFHWDFALFQVTQLQGIYPANQTLFLCYYFCVIFSPFWVWAFYKSILKQRFLKKLTETFQSIGLRNGLGRLPNFVFDKALDSQTRKLRLARAGISPMEFEKKKEDLASALHVYVDELRENRAQGTMDFIYGLEPMPREFAPESYSFLKANKFLVGTTRSKQYVADLRDTPHLLIAGQTGGGKSTFLRQFVTSLYLNNPSYEFSLIDLKGGLEFQLFENLPRVQVIGDVGGSVYLLQQTAQEIGLRMELLKANRAKDMAGYMAIPKEERKLPPSFKKDHKLSRHIIVVDEAAELFLTGNHASSSDVQSARRILSQVARQGRSLGIHLVIATQRPDSRALDPQVKANLPGVLCFQMVNDVSSISVLGTGRATDLPPVPGRSIWKNSLDLVEVQTPFMTVNQASSLLESHRKEEKDKPAQVEAPPVVAGGKPRLSQKTEIETGRDGN
jgi:DNA polymerase III delta prime subunit